MICPSCGAERPDADHFCGACGAPIRQAASQATAPIDTLTDPGMMPLEALPNPRPALAVRLPGGRTGEFFSLAGAATTIGRSPACDVFLDDITVSRNHAEVVEGPRGHVLIDLGSTNGSYVNHRLIDADEILADGDELQIGKFRLVFMA